MGRNLSPRMHRENALQRIVVTCWLAAATLLLGLLDPAEARSTGAPAQSTDSQPAHERKPKVTGAKVLAVGVFTSEVESREFSPSVADGIKDHARDFTLVKRGAVVEASLGTGIGIRYRLTGTPKDARVLVDVVVRHPHMVNPDTQLPMTHSMAQYERGIGQVEHNVWSFDTPASMAPGEYVIEILHRGRMLARQVFTVTVKK